jgi:hypothetical protein
MRTLFPGARGVALAGALCALVPAASRACSVCGCGDPLMQAGDTTPQSGALRLRLEADALSADARSDDDPDSTESLEQQSLRPVFVYSPVSALNLVLQVPFVRKDFTLRAPDGNERKVSLGLGDLDLGARLFAWTRVNLGADRRQELALTLGTSLPTGSNEIQVDGERIDEHAQLGTGSFGPYLGALYALHQGDLTLSATATARAHTLNGHGYRYGPAVLFDAGGQYRAIDRLALGFGLDGRWAKNDTAAGELQENTGGFVLSATPSAAVMFTNSFWLHLRVQVPMVKHLFGEQSVGPVFTLALQYSS